MSTEKRYELDVFFHMLYELKKGLRSLSLLTTIAENGDVIKEKLEECGYEYIIEELNSGYINVFFGSLEPIDVLRKFKKHSLSDFTPEEDFILGVLLGYNTNQQCKRYLARKAI